MAWKRRADEFSSLIFQTKTLPLLFPATRHDPSEAILTDRMGISPWGACDQFEGAGILREVPLLDAASLVTRNEFALVRVYTNIVDWRTIIVAAVEMFASKIPDSNGRVLAASREPLAFAVKLERRDVCCVAFKRYNGRRRSSTDLVYLDLPDSPPRVMVREQMPLQASQKRISWS